MICIKHGYNVIILYKKVYKRKFIKKVYIIKRLFYEKDIIKKFYEKVYKMQYYQNDGTL